MSNRKTEFTVPVLARQLTVGTDPRRVVIGPIVVPRNRKVREMTLEVNAQIPGGAPWAGVLSNIILRLVARCNGAIKIELPKRGTINALSLGTHRLMESFRQYTKIPDNQVFDDAPPANVAPYPDRFWKIQGPFAPGTWYIEIDVENLTVVFPGAVPGSTLNWGVEMVTEPIKGGDRMITLRADKKQNETLLVIEDVQGPVDAFWMATTVANITETKFGKVGLTAEGFNSYRRQTNERIGNARNAAFSATEFAAALEGKKTAEFSFNTGTDSKYCALRYENGKIRRGKFREVDPSKGAAL